MLQDYVLINQHGKVAVIMNYVLVVHQWILQNLYV